MSHRNARLTPTGRRIMIERIAAGTPQAHVAEQMLVSRATVSKWWRRWLAEGDAGREDRSSRPRTCPTQTPRRVEGSGVPVAALEAVGAEDDRDAHRCAGVDGAQDPGP